MAWFAIGLLSLGVLLFVVAPLLRSDAVEREQVVALESELVDLHSRRAMLLSSLKDLDDDHAAGKLDDVDYVRFEKELSTEAVQVLKRIEALENAPQQSPTLGPRPLTDNESA